MSEGPPKKVSGHETKEGGEQRPRFRTIEDEILEIHEDGSKTHRTLECNGHTHRRCVDKISYDEAGEITFVDELSREDEGPCDGNHG